jgi:hypothetical protein
MRADYPSIALYGGPITRLSAASAPRVVLTLPWADGPLPDDPWLTHLLPRADYNTLLLDRLAATPPPRGAYVGLFLADPLLRPSTLFRRLAGLGVAGVAAFPGLSRFNGGFAAALAQAGLTPAMEAARLSEAKSAGLATLAAVWDRTTWPPDAAPPDHVLTSRSEDAPIAGARTWIYPSAPLGHRRSDLVVCHAALKDRDASSGCTGSCE